MRASAKPRRKPSARREPLAAVVPRPAKRKAGRTEAAETPAHLRAVRIESSAAMRAYVRERLGFKLGKFANRIERVTVRLGKLAARPGSRTAEKRCKVKVVLPGLPSVVAEHDAPDARAALDGALDRAERAVRRSIQQRRTTRVASARRGS